MFAIAQITSGKNDRLGAVTISKTGDNKFFWIEDRDNCGAEIGDTVLIEFNPDDQFATYIPVENIVSLVTTGMPLSFVKKDNFYEEEMNVFDPKNA